MKPWKPWWWTPGVHVMKYDIPGLSWPPPVGVSFQTSFMFTSSFNVATSIRYVTARLSQDGRDIASKIEEEGEAGKPGWAWKFYTTEPVVGPVEFHLEVREVEK